MLGSGRMGKFRWLGSAVCCPCVRQRAYNVSHGEVTHAQAAVIKDEPQNETGAPEEDIDIDLNDPEVNAAATKIQASFKGHKARKEVQAIKEAEAAKTEEAKKPEEEEIDIDLNDPEVANAATKIQANFRGYKTRKGMKDGEGKDGEAAAEPAKEEEKKEEEEIDIDLDDPETAKAALKIQSTFRGHMARKEVKKEDA